MNYMNITDCDDYSTSIQVPQFVKPAKLAGGSPEMNGFRPVMYTGGFCVVFPYVTSTGKYAVRCWHAQVEGAQERMKRIAEFLSQKKKELPYFVDFQYEEEGINTSKGILPLVVMDWVNAKPLKDYIHDNINDSLALNKLADNFLKMVSDLHCEGVSHGDLQHGNIMVKKDGSLVLVDYDSLYVPSISGFTSVTNGLWGYQHPARFSMTTVSPKADYFSEIIIYTSIKALSVFPNLWSELSVEDTDTMIFSKEDIESKGKSEIFDKISKNKYISRLVDVIRNFLSKSSIEQLKPLEEVEPYHLEDTEKQSCKKEIITLLSQVKKTNEVKEELEWINSVDISKISLSQIQTHLKKTKDIIGRIEQEEREQEERDKIVDEFRDEWQNNGYDTPVSIVDNSETVKSVRDEWK